MRDELFNPGLFDSSQDDLYEVCRCLPHVTRVVHNGRVLYGVEGEALTYLYPWSSTAVADQALKELGEDGMRRWLAENWNTEFLSADPEVVKRLLPYVDLPRCGCRAATVLYAVEHDWAWVLDAANDPACGFTPAFWRNAFDRAQDAGSSRCVAWLLDAKAEIVSDAQGGLLDL